MDQLKANLSVEQEFGHKIFCDRVKHLSREEAQDLLMEMHQHMLFKDNLYRDLFLSQEKEIVGSLFEVKKS
ncbi:MAG: NblA/ycf18 family protein [Xenococcus sp. (in: cyanobacteria)]